MHLLDGKKLAADIRADLKRTIATQRLHPRLRVLLVGNNPASELYVSLKQKAAQDVGIDLQVTRAPADTPDAELIRLIAGWNADPEVDAILIQLPLPPGHATQALIEALDPEKDVDAFHPRNVEALLAGTGRLISPTHEGILRLIASAPLSLDGARASLLANSETFARPLAHVLARAGAEVRTFSLDERDPDWLKTSALVVSAIGQAGCITPDMVKDDAVIIDVGTNTDAAGRPCGDVDAAAFASTDVWLSPVPGGVGPMTVALLLKQTLKLHQDRPKPSGAEARA